MLLRAARSSGERMASSSFAFSFSARSLRILALKPAMLRAPTVAKIW